MKNFTTTELGKFREDFNKVVKELEDKYKVDISMGRISYSTTSFSSKMEVVRSQSEDGSKIDIAFEKFKEHATYMGLKDSDYGRVFTSGRKKYRITGIKPRSPKYPIIAEDVKSGTSYKFPIGVIK